MNSDGKINLLYVITKLELGGAQKQLLSLIKGLDRSRFNVFLFTAKEGLLIEEAVSLKDVTLRKSLFLERAINPFLDLLALIELSLYIRIKRISIVHTHSSKAGLLGRFAAALVKADTLIHTVHGWSFNDSQPFFIRRLFVLLERAAASFTDKLIVVSSHDKKKGLDNLIGDESKYSLIHYGIDYKEFNISAPDIREELGLNSRDLVVGMVACFKPQKCPQDFIKLASLLARESPGLKFILAGDGALRPRIERLISRHNLQGKVILTGWRRDMPRVLAMFDVFVLTSLWEGLPISVLEAIAALKPVVATDTGGISEVISENKTGFLVPLHDINGISRKVSRLLTDKSMGKRMSSAAFNSLGPDFTRDIMIEKNQQLYYNFNQSNTVS